MGSVNGTEWILRLPDGNVALWDEERLAAGRGERRVHGLSREAATLGSPRWFGHRPRLVGACALDGRLLSCDRRAWGLGDGVCRRVALGHVHYTQDAPVIDHGRTPRPRKISRPD